MWKTIEGNRTLRVRVRVIVRFLLFRFKLAHTDPWWKVLRDLTWTKKIWGGNVRWIPSLCRSYGVMFITFVDIIFCVILTLVCSLRACHMWLTRNHMFIREIWGKFTSFIFWNFEISLVSLEIFQKFKKVNSVNLSQISLLNMWFVLLISSGKLLSTMPTI